MTNSTASTADDRWTGEHTRALRYFEAGAVRTAATILDGLRGVLGDRAAFWADLARALIGSRRVDEGIAAARQALALDGGNAGAAATLAQGLLRQGRLDEADAIVASAVGPGQAEPELLLARAVGAILRGQTDSAIADLDAAIAGRAGFAEALVARAQMRARLGQLDAALDDADAAVRAKPKLASPHVVRARLLAMRGDHVQALDSARTGIAHDPGAPEGYLEAASAAQAMGQAPAALELLRAGVAAVPGHPELIARAGLALALAERHEEAVPLLEHAVALSPSRRDVAVALAHGLDRLQRTDEAEAVLRRAHERAPADADLTANLSLFLIGLAKLDEAAALAAEAAARHPGSVLVRAAVIASAPDPTDPALRPAERSAGLAQVLVQIATALSRREWASRPDQSERAEALAEVAAAVDPGSSAAPMWLGLARVRRNDIDGAIDAFREVVRREPGNAAGRQNLAGTLARAERFVEATDVARETLSVKPDDPTALAALASILRLRVLRGRTEPVPAGGVAVPDYRDEAAALARRALEIDPDGPTTIAVATEVLDTVGAYAEALAVAERAATLFPTVAESHRRLAILRLRMTRHAEAEAAARRAIELGPDEASNHLGLAAVMYDCARYAEAYSAVGAALAKNPDHPEAQALRVTILTRLNRPDEALPLQLALLEKDPNNYRHHMNAGFIFYQKKQAGKAIAAMGRTLELHARLPEAHQIRGASFGFLAQHDEAVAEAWKAVEVAPDRLGFWTTYLYNLSYHPTRPAESIFAEFERWGRMQAHLLPPPERGWDTAPDPDKRLRIGYVSPDFRAHTSRFYYEPLFEHQDRRQVELFAYSAVSAPDQETQRMRTYFDHWRPIQGLSDDAVAEMVRRDRIDILVDGTNHMAEGRLMLFARKPAPVQVTWLGSIWTTGLTAMDYTLQDPYMAPPGTEAVFTEKIWRLPHSLFCFRPPPTAPETAPVPSRATGYVTFGYTGRSERLNDRVIRAWARILDGVPGSRLVLDFPCFGDDDTRDHFIAVFERLGIDVSRVTFTYSRSVWDALAGIDIMLDSFPHSGGTMLFDGLWAGVPAVTLKERPPCGRIGTGLMMNLGLADWVADSEDDYVSKAIAFAGRTAELDALRRGMRDRMRASPLMDEAGFAGAVDHAFRTMWRDWCASQGAPMVSVPTDGVGGAALWSTRRMRWRGDYQAALDAAGQVASANPDSPLAALALAECQVELGDYAGARPIVDRLAALPAPPPGAWIAKARCHLWAGEASEALVAATRAREQEPLSHRPAAVEAAAHLRAGDLAAAEVAAVRALTLASDDPEALAAMAMVRQAQGQAANALRILETATHLAPVVPEVWELLAVAYARQGKLDETAAYAQKAVKAKPNAWRALCVLAELARAQERHGDAIDFWRLAYKYDQRDLGLLLNLADALRTSGHIRESAAVARRGVEVHPNTAETWLNLGAVMHATEDASQAIVCYKRALELKPSLMGAYSNLAALLLRQDRFDEAEAIAREGLGHDPKHSDTLMHLGVIYFGRRQLVAAAEYGRQALETNPNSAIAHTALAVTLAYLGEFDEAAHHYEESLRLKLRGNEEAASARLYLLSYHPTMPAAAIYAEFLKWAAPHGGKATAHTAVGEDPKRRLRIGYVSPDFRKHTSRFYYKPLFRNHDRGQVELYAYANVRQVDGETERFKEMFDVWRPVFGMPDDDLAELIRRDGIDILVDGTNHMADHRLLTFAMKPAPVQVTWLGSIWTTGLDTVDYSLQDPYMAPPEADAVFRETIWRLPNSLFCFDPPPEAPEQIGPVPALADGTVTFGYYGRTERLNDRVFTAWGRILARLPNARLICDFKAFGDGPTADYFRRRMARCGVDIGRVTMTYTLNVWEALGRIDVMLDSFPHSGGTMLFDALWMGVPIVTLAERPPCGRIGAGLMHNLKLADWVADSEDRYVEVAVAKAGRIAELVDLRRTLRDRMRASPLMDGPGFARAVEAAYRGMWEAWCAKGAKTAPAAQPEPGPLEAQLRQLRRDGQFDAAIETARAAVAAAPGAPGPVLALADALLELSRVDEADALLRPLATAEPPPAAVWRLWARLEIVRGQAQPALSAAVRAVQADPQDPWALIYLAQARLLLNQVGIADDTIARAAAMVPDEPWLLVTMAAVRSAQQRRGSAERLLRLALERAPGMAEAAANLSLVHAMQGRAAEALAASERAVALKPHLWRSWALIGELRNAAGNLDGAIDAWRRALDLVPGNPDLILNLTDTLRRAKRPFEAISLATALVEVRPDNANALLNLGAAQHAAGQIEAAIDSYRRALALDRALVAVYANLAAAHVALGQDDEAERIAREGLALNPQHPDLMQHLAAACAGQRRVVDAARFSMEAVRLAPGNLGAVLLAARALCLLGQFDQALELYDRAVALDPADQARSGTSRLFALSYHPTRSAESIFAEFTAWGDRMARPTRRHDPVGQDPDRRLRIGYVSPDFRYHTSHHYYLPLLDNHDRAQVELFAYSNVERPDPVTERFRGRFDHWRSITGLDDQAAADLIQADSIDILVDATNHMAGHRLGVFALRPAPVQVTWLGSIWTTGLKAMDYALQDPHLAPPGAERLFRETVHRLPNSVFCFQQPVDAPAEVGPLPALANGHVTFGYCGRTERLNERVFAAWARILAAVPTARLRLDYRSLADAATANYFRVRMQACGIDVSRVWLGFTHPVWDALSAVDIHLDSFPHSGGTILFEALWSGAPIVTLAERPPCGRIGAGLLRNIGLDDWIAETEDAYVARAVAAAGDLAGLAALRPDLRRRMLASPLMDGPAFARAVEDAFRTMWRRWCAGAAEG